MAVLKNILRLAVYINSTVYGKGRVLTLLVRCSGVQLCNMPS